MPYSVEEPGADDGDTCQEVELERGLNSHVAEKVPPECFINPLSKTHLPLSQEVFKFQQKMFIPFHSQVIDFMYSGDIILESTNFEDILKIQLVLDVTMLSDVLYKVSTRTGDKPSPCEMTAKMDFLYIYTRFSWRSLLNLQILNPRCLGSG